MTFATKLRAPGWYRVALSQPLAFGFAVAIVTLVRTLYGLHPVLDWTGITTVALIAMPLAFIVGIGCFDYWFRWASGAPTIPEDHSGHGARSWKDYFRVNTDHKVIGIQYIVTTFFFFIIGGLTAMVIRAELAQP
ncbi:MAG: cytochrome c oxidase subunit I, partial [Actinobacteria bacterium]|nr:cytochrome c oxidase subunit I [Actinomycetota bacterium]